MNPSTEKSCHIYFSLGTNDSADWIVQEATNEHQTKILPEGFCIHCYGFGLPFFVTG